MCIEADEKVADVNNCQMLYDQYEISISRLLPLLKSLFHSYKFLFEKFYFTFISFKFLF